MRHDHSNGRQKKNPADRADSPYLIFNSLRRVHPVILDRAAVPNESFSANASTGCSTETAIPLQQLDIRHHTVPSDHTGSVFDRREETDFFVKRHHLAVIRPNPSQYLSISCAYAMSRPK